MHRVNDEIKYQTHKATERKLERNRSHAQVRGESTHGREMPFGMKGPEKILRMRCAPYKYKLTESIVLRYIV